MISENSSPAFFIINNLSNQGNNTRYNILIYFSCRLPTAMCHIQLELKQTPPTPLYVIPAKAGIYLLFSI